MKFFLTTAFLFILLPKVGIAQFADTSSGINPKTEISIQLNNLLETNIFLNSKGTPQAFTITPKKSKSPTKYFYTLALLFLIFGVVKSMYSRYFTTLFKVFFNTSLKQNQLTDKLQQASLPSLIFNLFFVIASGLYVYFLILFFVPSVTTNFLPILCIAFVSVCYAVKYITLLVAGWLTNSLPSIKTYIFIIFLLNKVLGVFLMLILPFLALTNNTIASYAFLVSFIGIGLLLLLRYFRSYSLLQSKIDLSAFHFFLYILAIEVLPIAILYKIILQYFNSNS
ncbi:MAG: DUF4271 domain-containing protein [Ferruginibacter sp.]